MKTIMNVKLNVCDICETTDLYVKCLNWINQFTCSNTIKDNMLYSVLANLFRWNQYLNQLFFEHSIVVYISLQWLVLANVATSHNDIIPISQIYIFRVYDLLSLSASSPRFCGLCGLHEVLPYNINRPIKWATNNVDRVCVRASNMRRTTNKSNNILCSIAAIP